MNDKILKNKEFENQNKTNVKFLASQIENLYNRNKNLKSDLNNIISNSTIKNSLNIWKIDEKIFLIGEPTYEETDSLTKKNNYNQINNFLNFESSSLNVVFSFKRSKLSKLYKRCVLFDDFDFNLEKILEICKISKFLIKNVNNIKIFIEISKVNDEKNIILLSCILNYCGFFENSLHAFENIIMINNIPNNSLNTNIIKRFLGYFDKIKSLSENIKVSLLVLNQLIIANIPKIMNNNTNNILIKIKTENFLHILDPSKYYVDDNFIIISNINLLIFNDVKIFVYHSSTENLLIFTLSFNTIFYKQGILRFNKLDVETAFSINDLDLIFHNDFSVDLVLTEDEKYSFYNPLNNREDNRKTIRIITECFFSDYDILTVEKLKKQGFDKDLANFCAQMHFSEIQAKNFLQKLKNPIKKINTIKNFNYLNKIENLPEERLKLEIDKKEFKNEKREKFKNYTHLYMNHNNIIFYDLKLIEDQQPDIKIKKVKSSLFIKRKNNLDHYSCSEKTVVKNLHVSAINNISDTIFNELPEESIFIDYETFESNFCVDKHNFKEDRIEKQHSKTLISQQRLFLIALAIKSLEMNNINAHNLKKIIDETPNILTSEDILNISKITSDEKEYFLLLESNYEKLDDVEKTILNFYKIPELKIILPILKFEIIFFEEIEIQSKNLQNITTCMNEILKSRSFKILMKTVLKIINDINCKYSKNKNRIEGFKIDALTNFANYSVKKNITLINYLRAIIHQNELDLKELKNIKESLKIANNIDPVNIKCKINYLIEEYKKVFELSKELTYYNRNRINKFLSFVSQSLFEISHKYTECSFSVFQFNQKFGEDPLVPISYILNILDDFLTKIIV